MKRTAAFGDKASFEREAEEGSGEEDVSGKFTGEFERASPETLAKRRIVLPTTKSNGAPRVSAPRAALPKGQMAAVLGMASSEDTVASQTQSKPSPFAKLKTPVKEAGAAAPSAAPAPAPVPVEEKTAAATPEKATASSAPTPPKKPAFKPFSALAFKGFKGFKKTETPAKPAEGDSSEGTTAATSSSGGESSSSATSSKPSPFGGFGFGKRDPSKPNAFASRGTFSFSKSSSSASAEDEKGADEDPGSFKPSKPLVEVSKVEKQETGEENEEVKMEARCKVFILDKDESGKSAWKDKGVGMLHFNVFKGSATEEGKYERVRAVVRAQETHRIILNAKLEEKWAKLSQPNEKSVVFGALVSEEEEVPVEDEAEAAKGKTKKQMVLRPRSFVIKFNSVGEASQLRDLIKASL